MTDLDLDDFLDTLSFATDDVDERSVNSSDLVGNDDSSVLSSHTADQTNKKISRFIATIFPPRTDDSFLKPETYFTDVSVIQMWCGQFEICTTGTLHAHIYCEFVRNTTFRFNRLVKLFTDGSGKSCDIQRAKRASLNQRQCAINYVQSPVKRAVNTEPYVWDKNKFACEFKVTAIDKKSKECEKMRLWIESKPIHWTWDQVVHENEDSKKMLATCSWGSRYHQGRAVSTEREIIKHVVVLYGAGGTGKTTFARKLQSCDWPDDNIRYYRRNTDDGHFWGGGRTAYRNQKVIHYEEFCGQETFSKIKEVCDVGNSGPSVNVKLSGIELNHAVVVFTSNTHPAGWYYNLWSNEPKQFQPFWRRITEVYFFPELRPNGSPNTPTAENPPYLINQTAEWKAMNGNFEDCKSHANAYWGLSDDIMTDGVVHPRTFEPTDFFGATVPPPKRLRGGGPDKTEDLIFDLIGPLDIWPDKFKSYYNSNRLGHKERFAFAIYFLVNGCDPKIWLPWMTSKYSLSLKDVHDIRLNIKNYPTSNWRSYHIASGTWI